MSQPVIFVIDDDAGVTVALREDLDRRFGEDFRVMGETSAAAGLAALRTLTLCHRRHGHLERVPATALFVLIGGEPHTQWLPETVQRRYGYVLTGRDVTRDGTGPSRWPLDRPPLPLETSIPGVFAVGDVRCRSIKRVASAVGDGATAVRLVHEYLAAEHADEHPVAVGA